MRRARHSFAIVLVLTAAACGGGGGGGGDSSPPTSEPPPSGCQAETGAGFPDLVYLVPPAELPGTNEFWLASGDGCRTESIVTGLDIHSSAPALVYAGGAGFVAWSTSTLPSTVEILSFSVSGAVGTEVLTPGLRSIILTGGPEEHFFRVDAWGTPTAGSVAVYGSETLPLDPTLGSVDFRNTVSTVNIATAERIDLWSMTGADQFACLETAQNQGANPYLDDTCVMPASRLAFSPSGERIYFGFNTGHRIPGFEWYRGTARLERKSEGSDCRGSLPDLGNGWCGPEIVNVDQIADPRFPDQEPPFGGSVRPTLGGDPELLATDYLDGIQQDGLRNQRISIIDADYCASLYDDPAAVEPLLAAGQAWQNCLYEGLLQAYGPGAGPAWTTDLQRLYYNGYSEAVLDTVRVYDPDGVPTDGDHEVVNNGREPNSAR